MAVIGNGEAGGMRGPDDEQAHYLYDTARWMLQRRKCLSPSDIEEYIQEAVCHVARYWRYNPARKVSWKTYASRSIANAISTILRKHWKRQSIEITEADIRQEDEPRDNAFDEAEDIIHELVPDRELAGMLVMKLHGMTYSEIAAETGQCRTRVTERMGRLLPMFREAMLTQTPIDAGKLDRARPGRPGSWIVEILDEDGRVVDSIDGAARASRTTGIAARTIARAKDGLTHERNGVRWRLRRKHV